MCRRFVLALVLALCVPRTGAALEPGRALREYGRRFVGVASDEALSAVFTMAQTPDGYMWLGTKGGLIRFDGVRLVPFDWARTRVLDNDSVLALHVDGAGTLWIGHRNGLARYRAGRVEPVPLPGPTLSPSVVGLFEDDRGSLWFATYSGGWLMDRAGVRRYSEAPGLKGFFHARALPDGRVLLGGVQGLFALDAAATGETAAPRPVPGAEGGGDVLALEVQEDGTIWAGTAHAGLVRIDARGARRFGVADGLPGEIVTSLRRDRDGNLWIGTDGGLARWREDGFDTLGAAEGLPRGGVRSLFEDREGSLWVGLSAGGLIQLRDVPLRRIDRAQGLPVEGLASALVRRGGGLWVGSISGGLIMSVDGRHALSTRADGLCTNWVIALAEDDRGRLWVGGKPDGATAPLCVRDGGGPFRSVPGDLPPDESLSVLHLDTTGRLWLGGKGTLYSISSDGSRVVRVALPADAPALDGQILAMADGPGTLWVGTRRGLWRYSRSERGSLAEGPARRLQESDGLPSGAVLSLLPDGGDVWVGSTRGLAHVDAGGRVAALSGREGSIEEPMFALLADRSESGGTLWTCTARGILRASLASLRAAVKVRTPANRSLFDVVGGIPGPYCEANGHPRATRDRDGGLWFATDQGLVEVRPDRVRPNRVPPLVHLEKAKLNRRGFDPRQALVAPVGRGELDLEFTATTFVDASRVRFRYRLDPFDDRWNETAHRGTLYTNLPPGAYVFRVSAVNGDGVASEGEARLSLRLTPPLHATWPFRLSVLGLAAALVAAVLRWGHRRRLRALELQHAAILGERSRIAREFHDTVAQALTGVIAQLDAASTRLGPGPSAAETNVERARALARDGLIEARRSIWDLREEATAARDLREAIERHVQRLGLSFTVRVDTRHPAPTVSAATEAALLRIVQEALLNTERHARASQTSIILERSERTMGIVIEDDGAGFDPAAVAGRGGHYGLVGMQERVAALGGTFAIDSRPGAGTRIRITIPEDDEGERA